MTLHNKPFMIRANKVLLPRRVAQHIHILHKCFTDAHFMSHLSKGCSPLQFTCWVLQNQCLAWILEAQLDVLGVCHPRPTRGK